MSEGMTSYMMRLYNNSFPPSMIASLLSSLSRTEPYHTSLLSSLSQTELYHVTSLRKPRVPAYVSIRDVPHTPGPVGWPDVSVGS